MHRDTQNILLDTHKIIKKKYLFSCTYKNGPRKYYVLQKPG